MFRKRRRPTPNLGIPPPFMPMTGEHATLRPSGIFPYCAMMQVAAEDTYTNYVICRGFDPRIRRFINYPPGISVAKPFGRRFKGVYQIGQVFPALLPTQGPQDYTPPSPTAVDWRVGQNPGVASTPGEGGHPQSLAGVIAELIDHNSQYVNWILLDSTGQQLFELCAQETATRNVPYDCLLGTWNPAEGIWCYDDAPTVKAVDHRYGMQLAELEFKGLYQPMPCTIAGTDGVLYVCVSLDCEAPPEGCYECEGA